MTAERLTARKALPLQNQLMQRVDFGRRDLGRACQTRMGRHLGAQAVVVLCGVVAVGLVHEAAPAGWRC